MEIKHLNLNGWRNYDELSFDFSSITVLVGPNASGKTNFLEAIYFLACGKSFRSKDLNLLKWEKPFLRLEGEIKKKEKREEVVVTVEREPKLTKTVKINKKKKPTSHLLGHFNCVLFTPEEIELISTLPEARRKYLNLVISQSDRTYAYNLIHYRRSIEQRNSLLKRICNGLAKENELEVWDGRVAEYGVNLIEKRITYIKEINRNIEKNYQRLAGNGQERLEIRYLSTTDPEKGWADMVEKLVKNRERDVFCGVTSVGPHRDDLEFLINGKEINEFASRGEFRTVILALKLSEVEFFIKRTGESPVLLLDDVFSELDQTRRDLLSQIFVNQQTIVTTTDLDHISPNIIKKAKVIKI